MDELLTEQEVAGRLDCTRQTLWRWRRDRCGPPHLKIGRTIRYPASQFEEWLSSKVVEVGQQDSDDNNDRPTV